MTRLWLVRHGWCDPVGKSLAGRRSGVPLNSRGREQAERLARHFSRLDRWPSAVYTSPLERAVQTADPMAKALGLSILVDAELTDLDFGDWTGREIATLAGDPAWDRFNRARSLAP